MTLLSAARNVRRMGDSALPDVMSVPQKGSTTCFQGSLVVLNAGYAATGTVATGLIAIGICEETSVNAGADGAVKVKVKRGIFPFANSAAADEITQAEVGADCYIVDDATVAKTDGSAARSRAGKIVALESATVIWVQVGLGL